MLEELRELNRKCTSCGLRKSCNQVVPGIGIGNIMFVGEAPGQDEDLIGEPFVGASGKLLNKLLKVAGISREDVCITNLVHCRPPKNRNPNSDEIAACKKWLWEEIKTIKPKVICTLGKVPTKTLINTLNNNFRMKDVIGKLHSVEYMDSKIFPLYHPSFLLRNGNKKNDEFIGQLKLIHEYI